MNDASTGRLRWRIRKVIKWRPQLSLTTLLLLVAAIATLVAYHQTSKSVAEQETRLAVLRPLVQELVVHDVNKITAVRRIPEFYTECIWDTYIPPGKSLRLMLVGKAIHVFESGKHAIEYRNSIPAFYGPSSRRKPNSWALLVDGHRVFGEEGHGAWTAYSGDNDGGLYALTTGEPDEPLVLVFKTPPKVLNGRWSDKYLWIE